MSNNLLSGKIVNVMPDFKPASTELWLICPGRQSITQAVRLRSDTFREKSAGILSQLIKKGYIDESVLAWPERIFGCNYSKSKQLDMMAE